MVYHISDVSRFQRAWRVSVFCQATWAAHAYGLLGPSSNHTQKLTMDVGQVLQVSEDLW